ncbi:MBL fold metallo-hydrolase [Limimaricola pyoseonensis]|uniref:Glyoxylase, beta-lactamase superfamily II n=1 Tax=Limimaricola pyoseonensis TaxID=521013 RepID=A0A1G7JVT0_9RHOB|nr:MBL fold metallo-hydrolase [Limimaricola pyoseonensis]SDF29076.1 Glyoxylase, beta-lactamase superfamily II [Limimaricola pyoseonensis]
MTDRATARTAEVHEPPAPGEAAEIAPGVFWLRLPLPWALDHVNLYALDEGDGWSVIDTGLDTKAIREVWEALLAGPLGGKPVRRVVVTHHHPDHVGLAGWLMAKFGAELLMPRTGYLLARMLLLDEQSLPTKETLAFWKRAGMDPELLAQRRTERPFNFADWVAPLPLGYTRLREGGTIRMGGRDWTIRMGEGHAPEHATFWSADDDLVIGGDQLLPGISPNLGVQPTEPENDPVSDWIAACDRLSRFAEARHFVLPGHKRPYRGLPERLAQMAQGHREALDRLERHIAVPRAASDCFAPLFRRSVTRDVYGLALGEALGHLNALVAQGRAVRHTDEAGIWRWRAA